MEYFRRFNYSARNLLVTLNAHETAHNWWFGAVGNDPAAEPWLDEALATYSELLYYQRAHPADVEWWWGFRVNDWAPEGAVDSTAYELPAFRPYVNAVYLRGAQFLHAAREAMGDEAFFAFLQRYYAENAGRVVNRDEFLGLLQDSTNADLSEIVTEYFR
jgi:aminopeptidase N